MVCSACNAKYGNSTVKAVLHDEDKHMYVRFGSCNVCRTKFASSGSYRGLSYKFGDACPRCGMNYVPLGPLHKLNGWYAKWKIKRLRKK